MAAGGFALDKFLVSMIYPMAIGGAIVGILNGLVFYWLTLRAVGAYQKKSKMLKRLKWINQRKPQSPFRRSPYLLGSYGGAKVDRYKREVPAHDSLNTHFRAHKLFIDMVFFDGRRRR